MSWTVACATCGSAEVICGCDLTPDMIEQRRRLDAGIVALATWTDEQRAVAAQDALRRVTTGYGVVTDEDFLPPSMTKFQRDIEAQRMREL